MELVDKFGFQEVLRRFSADVRITHLFYLLHKLMIVLATSKLVIKNSVYEIFGFACNADIGRVQYFLALV